MIGLITEAVLSHIVKIYNSYGLNLETQYNSDLDMVTAYSTSLNLRHLFADKDLQGMAPEDLEQLKGDSYNLMMYKYSPLKRLEDRFNNFDLSLVFDSPADQSEHLGEWSKLKNIYSGREEQQPWIELFEKIRTVNESEIEDPYVKDMVMGEIEYTFKVISSSTSFMDYAQFLHVSKLNRGSLIIEIPLDFGEAGSHEFDYTLTVDPIDSNGHIDYLRFGNLQHLTFSAKITGPVFSFYQTREKYIKEVSLRASVLPSED